MEGDNPSEAYRSAYDAGNMSMEAVGLEAARLLRRKKVRERIAELRDGLQRSLGVSRGTLLRKIYEAMRVARGEKNPMPAAPLRWAGIRSPSHSTS